MKMLKYILFAILTVGIISAQETLTLENAVNIALNKNLNIQVSKQNAEIAKNNAHPGNAGLLPRIDLTAEVLHSDLNNKTAGGTVKDITTTTSAGISASYTLFNGLVNFNSFYKLEKLGKVGEIQNKLIIENTIFAVIQSYFE